MLPRSLLLSSISLSALAKFNLPLCNCITMDTRCNEMCEHRSTREHVERGEKMGGSAHAIIPLQVS